MEDKRPDLLVIGRENFAWAVELAEQYNLASVLILHGGPSTAIRAGLYSAEQAERQISWCRRATRRVTMAEHWRLALADLGIADVAVIPNPVNLNEFRSHPPRPGLRAELGIDADAKIVMHISNLKAVKRPLDIVYSAHQALQHDPKLIYVVLGEGNMLAELQQVCKEQGIASKFRFPGWVPHEHVSDYINLADIILMPSAHETQALVYLETQSCGRLLLASDMAGAREVVEDGVTGMLFRCGDIEDLVAKTLQAASNSDLCAMIGLRARKSLKSHAINQVVLSYETLFREIAAEPIPYQF